MKAIDATLLGYLTGAPARYARLFSLRLKDDSWYLFTDHQQDIIVHGFPDVIYKASNAIEITAIESTDGGIAQNAELRLNYVDNLSRDQVLAGLMDDALFIVDLVDWAHADAGTVRLMYGTLQRKSFSDLHSGQWNVKGQLGKLDGLIGEVYSAECRNVLGDARCGVDLTGFTDNFTVDGVTSGYEYTQFTCTISSVRDEGFFTLGYVTFGALGAERYEIFKDSGMATRSIILGVPRNQIISFGDMGKIVAGCDKRHTSCLNKFDNILRMRAEPFKPIGSLQVQT